MEQLLSLVRETFCPASLRSDRVQDFLEAGFEDIPVIEAIRRFRAELALLGPSAPPADQHVYLFSRRLRESTRAYLAGFRCTSLAEYQDRASAYERDRPGHRRATQSGGPDKRQRTAPSGSGAGGAGQGRGQTQGRSGPQTQRRVSDGELQCFGCGGYGHIKKTCKKPPVACFTCGQMGHRAAFCRQGKAQSQQGSSPAGMAGGSQRQPQYQALGSQQRS